VKLLVSATEANWGVNGRQTPSNFLESTVVCSSSRQRGERQKNKKQKQRSIGKQHRKKRNKRGREKKKEREKKR